MNKEFPLDYTERKGIVFDVSGVNGRDIEIGDIAMDQVEKDMFAAFYTGFIEKEGYGGKAYFTQHPQLSHELVEMLVKKEISIIGIDFPGIRRGAEHSPKDQYCADRGVFIIENLCNLQKVMEKNTGFIACTYPLNYSEMTGLPCRVIAKFQ